MPPQTTVDATEFFEQINSYLGAEERFLVERAFEVASQAHGDQKRKSGEPFFSHPLTVAYYLSEYHLDAPAIVAALMHDVAEDTKVSLGEIEEKFGRDVAQLVDGVTKLKDVTLGVAQGRTLSAQELQDATLHKMFDVMTNDVRVVIIKLFDRLHNMRTIGATSPQSQRRKATETLSVYAPLANRLGIWALKNELELLSLEVLNNRAYHIIRKRQEELQQELEPAYQLISNQIYDCLIHAKLDVWDVSLAPENIFTVYQDLVAKGVSYHDLDRTLRLVILMGDRISCYTALGHLHRLWRPVPGTFDDYIANARDNLYRSLHTTVVHASGQPVKLRLRTVAMDKVSDIGVLSRWLYAGTPLWSGDIAERVETFLANITENINVEPHDLGSGVKGVVEDVFRKQIRVYTPRGDVVELAQGATALDFAYAIHTRLGDQCRAAYVNDVLYPLNRPLKDGDRVRIERKLTSQPQRAWLDEDLGYIVTNYARAHARRWFRRLSLETAVSQGRQLLQDELNMLGYPGYPHTDVADAFKYDTVHELYHDLGRADLLPTVVAMRVLEDKWNQGPARELESSVQTDTGELFLITNAHGYALQLCGTCQPRPRDAILGFLRSDNTVTVHRRDCRTLRPEKLVGRQLKLGWGDSDTRQAHSVTIQIDVYDRPGLLFEIAHLMEQEQINISYIHTPPTRKGHVRLVLSLEIPGPRQLVRILHQIHAIANVYTVRRLPDGPPQPQASQLPTLYLPE